MLKVTFYHLDFFFCYSMSMHRSETVLGLLFNMETSENKVVFSVDFLHGGAQGYRKSNS